jgi:Asp-tRNA(Asn)/Glu-tRNA(Gln) amidotransferase C subunit
MEPLASANVAIRNAAMILRTDVARDDEPRDWFTIEDVADRVPEGVDEPVIAETLERY